MSRRRRRAFRSALVTVEEPQGEDASVSKAWMLTFSDLISLMLTFFVMLYSMSDVSTESWSMITDTLSRTLKPIEVKDRVIIPASQFNIATVIRKSGEDLDYLASVVDELVGENDVLSTSQVMRLDDRLIVALPGEALFETKTINMSEEAKEAVFALSSILRNISNRIGVNGYTDTNLPDPEIFESNWELSIARSAVVSNLLRESGIDQNITAFGFADSRYSDLSDIPEDRRGKMASRVDIVIFPSVDEG